MPDIDFQKIILNLIPKQGEQPVVFYASQYETARPFIADLMWGDTEFSPGDSCWAEIDIRKNDDNLVVITDDVAIDNNEVSVILPVQAVTCIGKNLGQVKIYADDDQLIAALNFILEVQQDPLAGGVTSETAIDNLTTQIEEIAQAEGYLKSDDVAPVALSGSYNDLTDKPTIPDMSNYYTKSETYSQTQVNDALALKANTADLATVATTGDYDDLLDKPVLPDMTQYYTKAEVDTLIDNIYPTLTASGDIATFITALNKPLVSVTADPLATEITRCGKNLCYVEDSDLFPTGDNLPIEVNPATHTAYVRCLPNTTLYFKKVNATNRTYFYGCNDVPASNVIIHILSYTEIEPNVYSVNSGAYTYIAFYYSNESEENIMACIDQEHTSTYEAYNGTTQPIADATTITTLTDVNNVFTDAGSVTVQYKYMSM